MAAATMNWIFICLTIRTADLYNTSFLTNLWTKNSCMALFLLQYHDLRPKWQPLILKPIVYRIFNVLTHWGWVTHICVGTNTNIGSDNGLSPGRRQAIIWTNAKILLIGPLGTNFSGNLSEIHIFSFKQIHLKMSSGEWRPFCLGLNVLNTWTTDPCNASVVTILGWKSHFCGYYGKMKTLWTKTKMTVINDIKKWILTARPSERANPN